jgi:hypothetical protein
MARDEQKLFTTPVSYDGFKRSDGKTWATLWIVAVSGADRGVHQSVRGKTESPLAEFTPYPRQSALGKQP